MSELSEIHDAGWSIYLSRIGQTYLCTLMRDRAAFHAHAGNPGDAVRKAWEAARQDSHTYGCDGCDAAVSDPDMLYSVDGVQLCSRCAMCESMMCYRAEHEGE